jgi:hypothetical protein
MTPLLVFNILKTWVIPGFYGLAKAGIQFVAQTPGFRQAKE